MIKGEIDSIPPSQNIVKHFMASETARNIVTEKSDGLPVPVIFLNLFLVSNI